MTEGKKTGKLMIIGIVIAVIAAAGVAGAMNAAKISNSIRRSFSSPAEYYQYVERKNRDTLLKYNEKSYSSAKKRLTAQEQTQKITYSMELGDTLKALMGNNGLENMSLISQGKQDDTTMSSKLQLQLNGKDALSFNGYMDTATGETYFQFPELTASYLNLTNTMKEAEQETGLTSSLVMAKDMDQYLPSAADLTKLLTNYSEIAIKHMETVEMAKNETLSVGDMEQKSTRLDVNCDDVCCYEIGKEMLETMQDDTLIKELIEKAEPEAYKEFQKSVKEVLAELEKPESNEGADKAQMLMQVYVNSQAQIIGRKITLTAEGETFTIQQLIPREDSKFAYDLSVLVNEVRYLNLSGNGSIKNDSLSGDFSLSMDDSLNEDTSDVILSMEDLIQVSVKKLDWETLLQEGIVKGEFEIYTEQVPKLSGYKLYVKTDGTKDQRKDEFRIMVGSDQFAAITIQEEKGEDPGVVKPDANAVVYDFEDEMELSLYTSEIDMASFLTGLSADTGVDLTPVINYFMAY